MRKPHDGSPLRCSDCWWSYPIDLCMGKYLAYASSVSSLFAPLSYFLYLSSLLIPCSPRFPSSPTVIVDAFDWRDESFCVCIWSLMAQFSTNLCRRVPYSATYGIVFPRRYWFLERAILHLVLLLRCVLIPVVWIPDNRTTHVRMLRSMQCGRRLESTSHGSVTEALTSRNEREAAEIHL